MNDRHPHRVCFGEGLREASTFGLGTISWGTKTVGDELDRLYDTFRAVRGNFFDSAHVYAFWLAGGLGASERALGEIVRRRGDRRNVLLATKGGHPQMAGGYPRPERYLSPELITQDITESLDRLNTESIDLYFLHRDDARVPVGEIVDLLNEHVKCGRILTLGASNWRTERIAEANAYAASHGKVGFIANQAKFSLANANPSNDPSVPAFSERDCQWHAETGLTVCAYSSTANGFFATDGKKGARGWTNTTTTARLRRAQRLAAELKVTPNRIALAYLLHQPFPVIPLLGTANIEHLNDALAATHVRLSPDQVRRLRDVEPEEEVAPS